ncbi:MAG: succinate dehydrogenase cytochrome b subunit [Myxococcaceae bacterium]|nr:succinate dehydrogenase cytochrome b subunit [Myxococcaceae bacterium]
MNTSIGAKVVMAVTGVGIWFWFLTHMAGNLMIYAGPEVMNSYAAKLHATPALLWVARIALLIAFPLHIGSAIRTNLHAKAARPVAYAYENRSQANPGSKTMLISGLLVATFILYHLAHFTWHWFGADNVRTITIDGLQGIDTYRMVVLGFQQPVIALIYIAAQILLAQHLVHGLYSMCQHVGLWGASWTPAVKRAAYVLAYGVAAGFISIPLSVMFGLVKLP